MSKLSKTVLNIYKEFLKNDKNICKKEINNIDKTLIESAKNKESFLDIIFSKDIEEGYYNAERNSYYFPIKNITCNNDILNKLLIKYYEKEGFKVANYGDYITIIWNHLIDSGTDK